MSSALTRLASIGTVITMAPASTDPVDFSSLGIGPRNSVFRALAGETVTFGELLYDDSEWIIAAGLSRAELFFLIVDQVHDHVGA